MTNSPSPRSCFTLGFLLLTVSFPAMAADSKADAAQPGFVKAGFILEAAPFKMSHTSTIAETDHDLLAAWVGGPAPRHPENTIWTARYDGKQWSAPVQVADGVQEDGKRFACWNPVLFQPKQGPLQMFYKVGPSPDGWWGMLMTSTDQGKTWSKPARLPEGFVGPVRNKPVELPDGTLLCGASTEADGWLVHLERLTPAGRWEKTSALNQTNQIEAIQPAMLMHNANKIQILCRTKDQGIVESWSKDGGKTWSPMQRTQLPNPNGAIDAVQLRDGSSLLVYNHSPSDRGVLNVAVSKSGDDWKAALILENQPGEYSYPAVIQSRDGLVHITYSWRREKIKHVVVDPRKLKPTKIDAKS